MQSSRKISIFVLGQEHCLNNHNIHELLVSIWLTNKASLEDFKKKLKEKNDLIKEIRTLYASHIYPLKSSRKKLKRKREKIKEKHKKTRNEKKDEKEIKAKIAAITQQIKAKEEIYKKKYAEFTAELEVDRSNLVDELRKAIDKYIFFEKKLKKYNVPIHYKANFFCNIIELFDRISPELMVEVVNKSHYLLIKKLKEILLTNNPDKIGLAIDSSMDLSSDLLNSAKGFTSSYLNLYMVRAALSRAIQREVVIVKFTLADIEEHEVGFHLDKALRFYGFDPKTQGDEDLQTALLKARSERRDVKAAASYFEHNKALGELRENEQVNFFLNRYPNALKYGNASFLQNTLFKNKAHAEKRYTEEVQQYHGHLLAINSVDVLLRMARDETYIINLYALIHHVILHKNNYFSPPESHIINDEFVFHFINYSKEAIEKVFSFFYKHNLLLPEAMKLFIYYYNSPEFIERGVIDGHSKVQANHEYKRMVKEMIEICQKLASNNATFKSTSHVSYKLYYPAISEKDKRRSRDIIVGRWSSQEIKTRISSSGSPTKRTV